jgi:hypothetical protein
LGSSVGGFKSVDSKIGDKVARVARLGVRQGVLFACLLTLAQQEHTSSTPNSAIVVTGPEAKGANRYSDISNLSHLTTYSYDYIEKFHHATIILVNWVADPCSLASSHVQPRHYVRYEQHTTT